MTLPAFAAERRRPQQPNNAPYQLAMIGVQPVHRPRADQREELVSISGDFIKTHENACVILTKAQTVPACNDQMYLWWHESLKCITRTVSSGPFTYYITEKIVFWTTHPSYVTLYNISLTHPQCHITYWNDTSLEKWPNQKLTCKTATITVVVQVNAAGEQHLVVEFHSYV